MVLAMSRSRPATAAALRCYCHRRRLFRLPAVLRMGLQHLLEGRGLPVNHVLLLLRDNSFWASDRSAAGLLRCLRGSDLVVSTWHGTELVAVGRATSDGIYRAVLWDVVVRQDWQGKGAGRTVVERLLAEPPVCHAQRVYAMTTHSAGFYRRLGFEVEPNQNLMILERP